jgi:hypothetical protein
VWGAISGDGDSNAGTTPHHRRKERPTPLPQNYHDHSLARRSSVDRQARVFTLAADECAKSISRGETLIISNDGVNSWRVAGVDSF